MSSRSSYTPTRREIQKACERIRATWSEDERRRRMGHAKSPMLRGLFGSTALQDESWTPPVIDGRLLYLVDERDTFANL